MPAPHYIIRGGVEGRERLRLLARVMRPTTLALLERIGLRPGMRCLDVGCGGGDVSFELARAVGAAGSVVAIDLDQKKLELARREAAAQQLANVQFLRAEVGADDLGAGFDLVYARFLLTHLREPAAAVAKMAQALRLGGVLAVEDIDASGSFCHPDCAAFRRYVELYIQAGRKAGADPCIGPKLPGLLADAGLHDVQMNLVQPAGKEGEVKLVQPLTMENIADTVVAAGLASPAEVAQIVAEIYEAARDPGTIIGLPRVFQTWGRRAAGHMA